MAVLPLPIAFMWKLRKTFTSSPTALKINLCGIVASGVNDVIIREPMGPTILLVAEHLASLSVVDFPELLF